MKDDEEKPKRKEISSKNLKSEETQNTTNEHRRWDYQPKKNQQQSVSVSQSTLGKTDYNNRPYGGGNRPYGGGNFGGFKSRGPERKKIKIAEVTEPWVLFMGNLSYYCNEEDIKQHFMNESEEKGKKCVISGCKVPKDQFNGSKNRGFAYVQFADKESCGNALKKQGGELKERSFYFDVVELEKAQNMFGDYSENPFGKNKRGGGFGGGPRRDNYYQRSNYGDRGGGYGGDRGGGYGGDRGGGYGGDRGGYRRDNNFRGGGGGEDMFRDDYRNKYDDGVKFEGFGKKKLQKKKLYVPPSRDNYSSSSSSRDNYSRRDRDPSDPEEKVEEKKNSENLFGDGPKWVPKEDISKEVEKKMDFFYKSSEKTKGYDEENEGERREGKKKSRFKSKRREVQDKFRNDLNIDKGEFKGKEDPKGKKKKKSSKSKNQFEGFEMN